MQRSLSICRDYWSRFEQFVRGLTKRCKECRVITGPLWMPSLGADGKWYMRHAMIGEAPPLALLWSTHE